MIYITTTSLNIQVYQSRNSPSQQILGYESIATTEIYTHVDEHQLQSAVNSNPLAMMFN